MCAIMYYYYCIYYVFLRIYRKNYKYNNNNNSHLCECEFSINVYRFPKLLPLYFCIKVNFSVYIYTVYIGYDT